MDNSEKTKWKILLKGIFFSFFVIVVVSIIGFKSGEWLKENLSLSNMNIIMIRIVSVGLIGWGVLGRLGGEIQSWDGDTCPEKFNKFWFNLVYIFGFYLLVVSFLLS